MKEFLSHPEQPLRFEPSRVSWATFEFVHQPPAAVYRHFVSAILLLFFGLSVWAYFVQVPVVISARGTLSETDSGWIEVQSEGAPLVHPGDPIRLHLARVGDTATLEARVVESESLPQGLRMKPTFTSPSAGKLEVRAIVLTQKERLLHAVLRRLLGTRPGEL